MKNRLFSFLLIGILLLGANSCDLSETPYGFYSEDNFYKTPQDAEAALMYAYNALTFLEYSRGIFYIGEAASETINLKSGEDAVNPGSQALDEWKIDDNRNNQVLQLYFKYCYIAINRANAVIYNVSNSDLEESVKKRILGEALFLRAYNHFNLVKVFGLVPIQRGVVESINGTMPTLAKNMDEIYKFMLDDLFLSESYLDYTPKVGRTNKAAVQGLIAKIYLTAASSKESGVAKYVDMAESVDELYSNAALWAKKVLDASESGKCSFGLSENLSDIYDVEKPDGPEHVFIMSMDRTGLNEGNYSKIGMLFLPYNNGGNFYVNMNNLRKPCHYGFEVFPTNNDFYNSFDTNDKRRNELMSINMYNADGSIMSSSAYPFTLKYTDPKQVIDNTGDKSSVKPYLLRFTDIALIYVEAMGKDDGGWLEKIRKRAGLANIAVSSVSEFRNAVVQERAWELAFEGNRLYDLRRKALVTQKDLNAKNAGLTEDETAFFPIPQREIDLNPNLR